MFLNEKIAIMRKMNHLTQEDFAEEFGVSRQAVSKWENGTAVPDVQMLLKIADYYNLTLDQLARDDFDLPIAPHTVVDLKETTAEQTDDFCIERYLGKICDVSMNSFRYSVLRNIQIVGITGSMVCFIKKDRYGYFNKNKSLGILMKKDSEYTEHNEIACGKCTVYANKGTYWGGQLYAFSSIEDVTNTGIEVHTGKFVSTVSYDDLSVIMMTDKISR